MKNTTKNQKILIGKLLRETRRSLGLTQEYVAEQRCYHHTEQIERAGNKTAAFASCYIPQSRMFLISFHHPLQ